MKRTWKYIIIVVAVSVAIALVTRGRPAPISEAEASFNEWYEEAQTQLGPTVGIDSTPHLAILLQVPGPNSAPWKFSSTDANGQATKDSRNKVSRLLQLIKEGRIFSLRDDQKTHDAVRLSVQDAKHQFNLAFSTEMIKDNIQAQNLLKLAQLYAMETPTPAAPTPNTAPLK